MSENVPTPVPDQRPARRRGRNPLDRPVPTRCGFIYWLSQALARWLARVWLRLEVTGVEHIPAEGGVLIAPTHTSYLDPPLVSCTVPRECCFLARENLVAAPIFGAYCRHVNVQPLRRGAGDREALRLCRSLLKAGWPLYFFPEGTRSRDGRLGPIQPGFAMLLDGALEIPIVPVVITGACRALGRGQWFPKPFKVRVRFGEPFHLPERAEGERARAYYNRCGEELERRYRALGAE